VLSAYGAATMDIRRERLCTLLQRLPAQVGALERAFDEVQTVVSSDLAADGVALPDREVRFEADVRFAGQRWELTIALPAQPARDDGGREVETLFRTEYRRRFGKAATTASGVVELVAVRAVGIGHVGTELARDSAPAANAAELPQRVLTPVVRRRVKLTRTGAAQWVDVHDGATLAPGDCFGGPALVDASDTTVWVPPGMHARTDAHRNLIIKATGNAAVEAAA
jgi:N-methylhydantoinase A